MRREEALWRRGINDWARLLQDPGLSALLRAEISEAERRYADGDAAFFYDTLPSNERWRMLSDFPGRLAFLDVELDGSGRYAEPTLVGIYRQGVYTGLVRGSSLARASLSAALDGIDVLVTYNGRRHDMHFLRRLLPEKPWQPRVIDLRYTAARAGFSGGLKQLEKSLGVARDRYVELAATGQATRLWRLWRRTGSRRALELLKAYNREDTRNLAPIALRLCEILGGRAVEDVF